MQAAAQIQPVPAPFRSRRKPADPSEIDREKALVEKARNGDQAAMDRLLRLHYPLMYKVALKVTGNPAQADDVTQESCVQVIRWIGQYRAEARFSSWLSRIVTNTARLRYRRERRLVPQADVHGNEARCPQSPPDTLASQRQLLRKTDELLSSLRDGDRQLFALRFIDGMSLENISHETGISLPALKSRFHRARRRLKAEPFAQ